MATIPSVYLIVIGNLRDKPTTFFVPVDLISETLLKEMEESLKEDRPDWWSMLEEEIKLKTPGISSNDLEKQTEILHESLKHNTLNTDNVVLRVLKTYSFV